MKRRDFIIKCGWIGAGYSFLPLYGWSGPSDTNSRVSEIQHPGAGSLSQKILGDMLDAGMGSLFNADSPEDIWKNLFSKKDVVGIKVNCLSGQKASSHPELVHAIINKLRQTGIPPEQIIIWDRVNADLKHAGYQLNWKDNSGIKCFGNDAAGYHNRLFMNGSIGSLITRTVTDICTAIINVPVLKDHGIVGVTLSMKNFFGAIHNPNKYHLNCGDPFVADLYELDIIRRKTRLIICDAIEAQYEGGPPFKPQWSWPMNSLLFAVDGVALDRVGWEIIEKKRAAMGFPSLEAVKRKPQYILTAGEKGLGQSDLARIDWRLHKLE